MDLIEALFIDNKYTKWYWSIINKAKNRQLEGYGENHHICPKSCGGSNDLSNLVKLAAKEHFVCHHLLTKMMFRFDHENKMKYAFWRMLNGKTTSQFSTANLYEHYKKIQAELVSKKHKGKLVSKETREKIGKSSLGRKHSSESREKNRQRNLGKKMKESHKAFLSKLFKGRVLSKEHCEKLSIARKGIKFSETHKNNIKESFKNYGHPSAKQFKVKNNITGEFFSIKDLSKWCKEQNLNYAAIRRTAHRKSKLNWKLSYV